MPKHSQPPARQRYEADHPTLTVRIPLAVKTAIIQAAEADGLSVSEWLQAQVAGHVTDVATAYQRGLTSGRRAGWMAGILSAQYVHATGRTYNRDAIRRALAADASLAHCVQEICTAQGQPGAWDAVFARQR